MKLLRLYHIGKIRFQDLHLDRIDNTELALKLMWQNYHLEKEPYKKFQMLKDIILVQPYLSAYYETTKLIFDKQKQSQQLGQHNLSCDKLGKTNIDNNNNLKF